MNTLITRADYPVNNKKKYYFLLYYLINQSIKKKQLIFTNLFLCVTLFKASSTDLLQCKKSTCVHTITNKYVQQLGERERDFIKIETGYFFLGACTIIYKKKNIVKALGYEGSLKS